MYAKHIPQYLAHKEGWINACNYGRSRLGGLPETARPSFQGSHGGDRRPRAPPTISLPNARSMGAFAPGLSPSSQLPRKAGGAHFAVRPAAGTERRDLGRAEGSTEARSARTGTAGRKGDSGPKARRQGPESWAQTAVRGRGHHRDALRPGASPGRSCPGQAPTGTEGGQRQTAPGSPRRGAHALADCRPRVWAER